MIMENFKKFSLDEQQAGPNLGAGINAQLSSGPGASIRAQLAAKKAAAAMLTPEVRKKIKAMAGEISSTSRWSTEMLNIDSVKKFLSTQFDSKDAREVLDAINNNHGNIENGWQVYRRYILKDQEFWNKILLKVYPVFSENWVKNNLNNFLDKELKKRAGELDNKFDSLDYFDGFVNVGTVRRLAELCIEWTLKTASYKVNSMLKREFSVSPAPAPAPAAPAAAAPAGSAAGPVASFNRGLEGVAKLLGINVADLEKALATPEGQRAALAQLQNNDASDQEIAAVKDYVQQGQGSAIAPATPATPAPAAAPAAATATTPAAAAPAAAPGTAAAAAATGGGGVDARRTRIAKQAVGDEDAVTKLQALLVNAGYSVSEIGGTTSFAPAATQVQEVVNNLSEFKNFNNIWDRWLISEQVKLKDYAKFGIDGKYGPKTIDAVRRFQQDIVKKFGDKAKLGKTGPGKNGVDGTMGKMTWAYLQKVNKGQVKLAKPTPERKPENFKKTQAQTKAVSDTKKVAYKETMGFLNAVHKIVNNSADNRKNNAYIQLRKYTKATRTSKGASGNSLWNDPRFWKFWIEGKEEEIKKIIRAGGGKKYSAAISASMPQDDGRAKLTPLVTKYSQAIEAYTKALEAREDPTARKFPKRAKRDKAKEAAKRDKAKEAGFLDKMFDGMRAGPGENIGPAIEKLSAIFKQSLDKGRLAAMANGSVIRDNKAIIYSVGTGKKITDDVLDLYQAMKGAGTDDEKVKSILEEYSSFFGVSLENSPLEVFNLMFEPGSFYFKAHALFVMYQGYLTAINKKAKSEEEDLSENLLDWLRDDGFTDDRIYLQEFKLRLSFEKEVAKRILMIINPNNFNKLKKSYGANTENFNERIDIRMITARASSAVKRRGAN